MGEKKINSFLQQSNAHPEKRISFLNSSGVSPCRPTPSGIVKQQKYSSTLKPNILPRAHVSAGGQCNDSLIYANIILRYSSHNTGVEKPQMYTALLPKLNQIAQKLNLQPKSAYAKRWDRFFPNKEFLPLALFEKEHCLVNYITEKSWENTERMQRNSKG